MRCHIILKGATVSTVMGGFGDGQDSRQTVIQFQWTSRGLIKQEELLPNSIKVLFSRAILISLHAEQHKNNKTVRTTVEQC